MIEDTTALCPISVCGLRLLPVRSHGGSPGSPHSGTFKALCCSWSAVKKGNWIYRAVLNKLHLKSNYVYNQLYSHEGHKLDFVVNLVPAKVMVRYISFKVLKKTKSFVAGLPSLVVKELKGENKVKGKIRSVSLVLVLYYTQTRY